MKKLLCFSLAFISYICIANGQWQQQKMNVLPERSRDHVTKPMQSHHSNKDNLPVWNMKTDLFNTRSLQWDWDIIFTYDTLGGLMQRLTQTFDIHGNPLIQLTEQWQTNAWVNNSRITYTYDANGNCLTYLDEEWQTNAWVNYYRYTYTYNASGNCLTYLEQEWQTNTWVNSYRDTYTYDANGNRLTELEEEWQTNAWVIYQRVTYTYDANGNMLTELQEVWQTNAWVNAERYTYTYDANGNMLTDLQQGWQNNAWVNWYIYTYTYDANGNLLTELTEQWQTNAWVNHLRITYTYDANGNCLTYLDEEWQTNTWVNYWRDTFTYDANGNSITGKFDAWQSGNWEPGMGGLILFSQKQWIYFIYGYRYEAHYIIITGISDIQATNSNLSVFPNPANDKITIEISGKTNESNLAIVNIEGQELITRQITAPKTLIDITNLPNGVYFVRLTNDRTIEVRKFVKQ